MPASWTSIVTPRDFSHPRRARNPRGREATTRRPSPSGTRFAATIIDEDGGGRDMGVLSYVGRRRFMPYKQNERRAVKPAARIAQCEAQPLRFCAAKSQLTR